MMKILFILAGMLLWKPVLSQSGEISITYSRDMDFGYIIPGTSKTITEISAEAGKFTISGISKGMTVSVFLNLPAFLTGSSGNIPVIYTATQSTNSNDYQPGEPFNAYTGTAITFDERIREQYIRIGGTINPQNSQAPGHYTAPVIITLTVLSN